MAIETWFESLGQVSVPPSQTIEVGWELRPGEFPPIVDLSRAFGFDPERHFLRVSPMDHEGPGSSGNGAFFYTITNISSGPAAVVAPVRNVFFKAT